MVINHLQVLGWSSKYFPLSKHIWVFQGAMESTSMMDEELNFYFNDPEMAETCFDISKRRTLYVFSAEMVVRKSLHGSSKKSFSVWSLTSKV